MINPFWKNKSVLVTGAGGFIGSHLVERLHSEGARVRAFVRYNSRGDIGLLNHLPDDVCKEIEIIGGNIRDSSVILKAAENIGVAPMITNKQLMILVTCARSFCASRLDLQSDLYRARLYPRS
jgi:NAD(P)-dependent dehydrogenase (short-subunit alcohol dehydrogenase family)